MAKKLRVTMPDGTEWDVPAEIIAKSRAEYYCGVDADADFDEEYEYALYDHEDLIDWAENNMNWEDVAKFAQPLGDRTKTDYQEGWVNGEKEVVEC
ncbi:hypothetical protein [Brevibacillus porteri]|uniref:hypothetical protein n=1 Tax=Brevibacillus porteri TaxID=2126350 RepID=UPI003D234C0C